MKLLKIVIFCLSTILLSLNGSCSKNRHLTTMKKIVVEAVIEESEYAKKLRHAIGVKLSEDSYLKKSAIFEVFIYDSFSRRLQVFRVAIAEDYKAYVFYADENFLIITDENYDPVYYLNQECNNFSEIIKQEDIVIDNSNVNEYVNIFLSLVEIGTSTTIIGNIDEMTYLPPEEKKNLRNTDQQLSHLNISL